MFAHFAGNMRQDLVLVVQHDAEHGPRQNGLDGPFQFDWLFGAHRMKKNPLTMKKRFGRRRATLPPAILLSER
jgi:hypothetical protein